MTALTIAKMRGTPPSRCLDRQTERFAARKAEAKLRERLEAAIEAAAEAGIDVQRWIDLLDALDSDVDFEPDYAEPDNRDLPVSYHAGPTMETEVPLVW